MPNENSKPRPWLQLHLSTCVVLMVVAGVLAWVNMSSRPSFPPTLRIDRAKPKTWEEYGWPFKWANVPAGGFGRPAQYDHRLLAYDVGIALGVLFATAIACEKLIRRRERRRAAQEPAP